MKVHLVDGTYELFRQPLVREGSTRLPGRFRSPLVV